MIKYNPQILGAPPIDKLLAYYPFDSDFNDYSGNNYHLTNRGATLTQGKINQGAEFSGLGDYLLRNDFAALKPNLGDNYTYSFWINFKNPNRYYMSPWEFTQQNRGWPRYLRTNFNMSRISSTIYDGTNLASLNVNIPSAFNLNEWYHVVMIYDFSLQNQAFLDVYINTIYQGSDTKTIDATNLKTTYELYIGVSSEASQPNFFQGIIDEFLIYEKKLNQNEINALFSENVNLDLEPGWNLISTPLQLDNPSVQDIFTTEILAIYEYNTSSYITPTTLEPKKGYWIAVDSQKQFTLQGTQPTSDVNLKQGWNLIAFASDKPIPQNPEILAIYEYNTSTSSYVTPTTIKTKKGYWIASTSNISI